jgi:hypothetical protein
MSDPLAGMTCLSLAVGFEEDRARVGLSAAVERLRDALAYNGLTQDGDDRLLAGVLTGEVSSVTLAEAICSAQRMGLVRRAGIEVKAAAMSRLAWKKEIPFVIVIALVLHCGGALAQGTPNKPMQDEQDRKRAEYMQWRSADCVDPDDCRVHIQDLRSEVRALGSERDSIRAILQSQPERQLFAPVPYEPCAITPLACSPSARDAAAFRAIEAYYIDLLKKKDERIKESNEAIEKIRDTFRWRDAQ